MRRLAAALVVLAAALAGCDAPPTGGDPATAPRLTILAPTMDRVLEVPAGKDPTVDDRPEALAGLSAAEAGERRRRALPVHVVLDLQNYAIGRVEDGGDGQHVHVVLDDEPYVAVYDVTRGLRLDPRRMTPGTHVLRVFPSAGPRDRAGALHHEARKNPGAFAWVRFHVGAPGGPLERFDGAAPCLTFSRPKGEYRVGTPEHAKFLVDWWVTGATLAPGRFAVKATLDGQDLGTYTTWARVVLPTPPAVGTHKLALTLVDGAGRTVPGPFNATERTFKVVP